MFPSSPLLCLLAAVIGTVPPPSVSAWTTPRRPSSARRNTSSSSSSELNLAPQQLGSFETLDLAPDVIAQRVVRLESYLSSSSSSSSFDHHHDQEDNQNNNNNLPRVPYQQGWDRQQELWQAHADRIMAAGSGNTESSAFGTTTAGGDAILILQHEPIYTLGTASDETLITGNDDGAIPVQRINRGGEVTYHGPGQLTVYPVLDLRQYRQDIHWYMRALEQVVILALQRVGVPDAQRDEETTGVWVQNHKVAAVGVHARKWITQHGLAINVTPQSLEPFTQIVPCGLHGRNVGSVQQFCDHEVTMKDMAEAVVAAFEEVFEISLQEA